MWWGNNGSRRGWTIATLIVFGIVLALFLPKIATLIAYGLTSMLNMTSAITGAFTHVNNVSAPQNITLKASNYTASVPVVTDPFMAAVEKAVIPFIQAFLILVSNPYYLGMIMGITLIFIALSIKS